MGTRSGESVLICIISPTRMVLVKDKRFKDSYWKLPGGGIESKDANVIAAAIRECLEETGIQLLPSEFPFHFPDWRKDGAYRPHFCIARITEKKLDTRLKFGDENGHIIMVAAFERFEVPEMPDLLAPHRPFVNQAMTA